MLKSLKKLIHKQEFNPSGFLGMLINPFYFSRRALCKQIKISAKNISGKTLDAGCGTKPYSSFFTAVDSYVGMEVDASKERLGKNIEVYYSGQEFPFPNESFDSLVSFQVLEHVPNPEFFISEIYRVLRIGGTALITAPFMWEEHESPYDFTRFSSFGMKARFVNAGFKIESHTKLCTGIQAIVQLLTSMITVELLQLPKVFRITAQIFIIFPIHFLTILLGWVVPQSDRTFLDNVLLVKKST